MSSLLSLPAELRKMIYSHALIVGNVYPYRKTELEEHTMCQHRKMAPHHQAVAHPCVNILFTCRLIHQEAVSILYSQNIVNLPVSILTERFFKTALHNLERCSWVKSVHIGFLTDDLTEDQRTELLQPIIADTQKDLVRMSNELRVTVMDFGSTVHQVFNEHLRTCAWSRKVNPVLENLKLDMLILDFDDCTCVDRCCQMAAYALSSLKPGFAHEMPKEVTVLGFEFEMYDLGTCDRWELFDGWMEDEFFIEGLIKQWTEKRRRKAHGITEDAAYGSDPEEFEREHMLNHWLGLDDAACENWPWDF